MTPDEESVTPVLTADAFCRLAAGTEDVEQGRTVSLDEAKEQLGLDEHD